METELSHSMPSINWRPRKASCTVQSESESLRTRGANATIPSHRAGEDADTSSAVHHKD